MKMLWEGAGSAASWSQEAAGGTLAANRCFMGAINHLLAGGGALGGRCFSACPRRQSAGWVLVPRGGQRTAVPVRRLHVHVQVQDSEARRQESRGQC